MSTKKRQLRNEISSYFAKFGLKEVRNENEFVRNLEKVFGAERSEEFMEILEAKACGQATIDEEYSFLETIAEVTAAFSQQAGVAIDIAEWLSRKLPNSCNGACTIHDLGCSVGLLTSWLAKEWPEKTFVGVDQIDPFLDIARNAHALPNCTFAHWDYANQPCPEIPKFDAAVCSLGIDFPRHEIAAPLDGVDFRQYPEYKSKYSTALPIFQRWREAAQEGAHLFVVLRLSDLSSGIGVAQAAFDAGWDIALQDCVRITSGNELFPSLVYCARTPQELDESGIHSLFIAEQTQAAFSKPLIDEAAILFYAQLAGKKVMSSDRKEFDGGHAMICNIGVAGPWAFRFNRATTGFARLELTPHSLLPNLEPIFCNFPEAADGIDETSNRKHARKRGGKKRK